MAKMNPLTQIHVEELMDLLNNYLMEVFSQINKLERHSLENLNERNYSYIISGLEEFSKMIEGNHPTIQQLIESRFNDGFTLHNKALLLFFNNVAIMFIGIGYEYAKGKNENRKDNKK
jgi:hypothetical protein